MITKKLFGNMPDGREVYAYTICRGEAAVTVLNLGGIIQSLCIPDRNGCAADIVCGFDTVEGYLTGGGYHGSLIGRYANRINGGSFTLNGEKYTLANNEEGINHLHGGNVGFNLKLWDVKEEGDTLVLSCVSEDGEEGYPGRLCVSVTYTFTGDTLRLRYQAVSDKDTVCNLTNHSYFNLAGYASCDISDHVIRLDAEEYTASDDNFQTLGNEKVAGTKFDLRKPVKMTAFIDNNYMLCGGNSPMMKLAAEVSEPTSGRCMTVVTEMPCVQLYTANMMDSPVPFKGGVKQVPHTAFCLETQFPPDSPNRPEFPSPVLKAGEKYDRTTVFSFRIGAIN